MGQRACRTRSGKFATESRPGDVPCCEGTERLDGFGAALRGRAGLGHLRRLEQQHGRGTAAYYRAVRKAVVDRDVAPSVVVGGGYKNARKAALDWLDDALARANRPGRWRWQGFDGMVPCRDCGTGGSALSDRTPATYPSARKAAVAASRSRRC